MVSKTLFKVVSCHADVVSHHAFVLRGHSRFTNYVLHWRGNLLGEDNRLSNYVSKTVGNLNADPS